MLKNIEHRNPDIALPSIQVQLRSFLKWELVQMSLNQLKQIKQPVLVINGSNDIVVPTVNSYTLFQNIPNAQSSLFPDSGHGSIFQYPDWFLKEAIPFLNNAEEYQMIYRLNNKKTLINRGFFVFAYEHFFL